MGGRAGKVFQKEEQEKMDSKSNKIVHFLTGVEVGAELLKDIVQ
jgi:hypothetical protein